MATKTCVYICVCVCEWLIRIVILSLLVVDHGLLALFTVSV